MAFIQMDVPLVFWGQQPPSHEITCVCRCEEKRGVATGSRSGQICLWDICKERETEKLRMRPRCMLFSGNSAIISLCFVRNYLTNRDFIASLSSKGTVSLWDGKDGACLKYVIANGHHTGIKSLSRSKYSETLIALFGQYSDIFIMDSISLETICVLRACYNPNWNAQICFLSNVDRKDAVLALTVDGVAKLWLLPSRNEMKETEEIYEEKAKTLGFSTPLSLCSCSYGGHSTALVVCKDAWQLYDVTNGRMKLLMIHACEPSIQAWTGGDFLDYRTIIVWSKDDGRGIFYRLSSRCVPGIGEGLEDSIDTTTTAGCTIEYVLGIGSPAPTSQLASYLDKYWHIQGDREGRLYLWDIRRIREEFPVSHSGDPIPYDSSGCISDSWEPPALPCGLTDVLYPNADTSPTITCALYLAPLARLVCGQADGFIAVLSATQAATVLMLQPRKFSRGWPQYCIMSGHQGRVNCLLYPHSAHKAYSNEYLLSGGADFTVKQWDLYSGDLVHTFAVHGGGVRNIIPCPPDINPRLQTCVCSIAEDYSVAILSTSERKCLLVAACHSSPVDCVRFRLQEDFLLVSCTDGRLYIWQIETGSLDRCVDGETAQIILQNTTETSNTHQPSTPHPAPLQVQSLHAGEKDSLIQVLMFEPQVLINALAKLEKLEEIPKRQEPKKKVDAFRTYLYARRHFGAGTAAAPAGRGHPRRSSQDPLTRSLQPARQPPAPSTPVSSRVQERAREVLGQAVASSRAEQSQVLALDHIINIVRLLLSCLHAWNLDEELDKLCEEVLGLVRPCKPISFGLRSKGGCMSLVLPGWGLRFRPRFDTQFSTDLERISEAVNEQKSQTITLGSTPGKEQGSADLPKALTKRVTGFLEFTFDQKYHTRWQLSRSLTTQHLLTMVSITNTLMNQSVGAHELARSSGMRSSVSSTDDDSDSDSEEAQTTRDNHIRAVWSQVAALHCVMLPERMEGKFRPPHLPVLASRFLDPCQAIREAAQALLQAELRRIGPEGRQSLVERWAIWVSPASFKAGVGMSEKSKDSKRYSDEADLMLESSRPIPTLHEQATALVILGMIGAEFASSWDRVATSRRRSDSSKGGRKIGPVHPDPSDTVMDPAIARQTAKTLQTALLEKPNAKLSLHSNIRCSAAELIGRGFHLWEKYVDIPQVVMGLMDLVIQYSAVPVGKEEEKAKKSAVSKSVKFASEVARRALNLMILMRPVTMVTTLAKEVATFLAFQHVTHFPHSSLPPIQVGVTPPPSTAGIVTPPNILLPQAKGEILDLLKTVIEKCSQQISLQLLEVVDIVLYCLDQDLLKKRNLLELFPVFSKLPNLSYAAKTKRLAVGARSGQVGIYDLKQGRTQMLNAHSHPVTVLLFSEDGKMLATYAYGDSALSVWQIGTSLFGINQTPKFVNSWPAISSSSPSAYMSFIRLEWSGSRSIILHMPGGVECKYSL